MLNKVVQAILITGMLSLVMHMSVAPQTRSVPTVRAKTDMQMTLPDSTLVVVWQRGQH